MPCLRHQTAAIHGQYCAACLLEQALVSHGEIASTGNAPFSLQVPLGETPAGAVYLVYSDEDRRLFRLKTSYRPAPAAFMDRFEELQGNLRSLAEPLILLPLRAWVDQTGRPSVLSDFRKGQPILDCVRSGRLAPHTATRVLTQLRAVTAAGHRRGLVHGSIVPGNVLVDPSGPTGYLVDFGLAALLLDPAVEAPSAAADEAGYLALERTVLGLDGP